MHQATEVLIGTACGLAGIAVGIAAGVTAIAVLLLARGDRDDQTPAEAPGPGVVATGYRFCPAELRTRAAVLHDDGTAACLDCGTTIPITEAPCA